MCAVIVRVQTTYVDVGSTKQHYDETPGNVNALTFPCFQRHTPMMFHNFQRKTTAKTFRIDDISLISVRQYTWNREGFPSIAAQPYGSTAGPQRGSILLLGTIVAGDWCCNYDCCSIDVYVSWRDRIDKHNKKKTMST